MDREKFERCNGFLETMALLNSEISDVCATFELELLPAAADMSSALGRYFEDYGRFRIEPAREFSAERWNVFSCIFSVRLTAVDMLPTFDQPQ